MGHIFPLSIASIRLIIAVAIYKLPEIELKFSAFLLSFIFLQENLIPIYLKKYLGNTFYEGHVYNAL